LSSRKKKREGERPTDSDLGWMGRLQSHGIPLRKGEKKGKKRQTRRIPFCPLLSTKKEKEKVDCACLKITRRATKEKKGGK